MRLPAWIALVGALSVAATADARAFRQTYGATVPAPGGGCVWDMGDDYFVPRHCDSCRYGLFSACKQDHATSPACRNLHPEYSCYCTPYGECRYRWRDHVYKTYCGCTPQSCYHGPWKLEQCKKRCFALKHDHKCGGGCETCSDGMCQAPCGQIDGDCSAYGGGEMFADPMMLPNVESMAGETLGSIPALARTAAGSGVLGALPGALPQMPKLPSLPAATDNPLTFPASNAPMALPPDSTF